MRMKYILLAVPDDDSYGPEVKDIVYGIAEGLWEYYYDSLPKCMKEPPIGTDVLPFGAELIHDFDKPIHGIVFLPSLDPLSTESFPSCKYLNGMGKCSNHAVNSKWCKHEESPFACPDRG